MNPASRLLDLYLTFQTLEPKRSIMEGWKRLLNISDDDPRADEDAYTAMNAALAEIRHAQRRLDQLGAPQNLFAHSADVLRRFFSPSSAPQQMSGFRNMLYEDREVQSTLKWASWALSKFDDPDLTPEAFADLEKALAEQEQILSDPRIPVSVREMLERQVRELRLAIRLYRVKGSSALHEAVQEAYGEFRSVPESFVQEAASNPESKNAVHRMASLLGKAARVADDASKVGKFAKEIYELGAEHGPLLIEWIKGL